MTVVLDVLALLAYLKDEPGSEEVDCVLEDSLMSSVNWAEVIQKSISAKIDVNGIFDELQALGLKIEPFEVEDGELAGRLWTQTKQAGLSLGDAYG